MKTKIVTVETKMNNCNIQIEKLDNAAFLFNFSMKRVANEKMQVNFCDNFVTLHSALCLCVRVRLPFP